MVCTWLTLAGERSGPGELRDIAIENARTALVQLNPEEREEVTRRVAHWRDVFEGL